MKKQLIRILSMLLTIVLTIQLFPVAVFAEDENGETQIQSEEALAQEEEAADDEAVEVLFEETAFREETIKHFRMSDGSFVAVDYQQPVHYIDEDGEWEDIDNRLVEDSEASGEADAYTSSIGDYQKTFEADLSDHTIFSVGEGDHQITVGLPDESETEAEAPIAAEDANVETATIDEAPATIEIIEDEAPATIEIIEDEEPVSVLDEEVSAEEELSESIEEQTELPNLSTSVVYEDAIQGADLQYESVGYDVKESIVVSERQESYAYPFTLSLDNLTARLLPDGRISIQGEGKEMYYIPAPYMVDANGVNSDAVYYMLEDTGDGTYLLTVIADSAWINAEERAFPVQIDPTLCKKTSSSNSVIINSFIRSANPSSISSTYAHTYCGKSTAANTSGSAMGALQSYFYVSSMPTLPANSRVMNAYLSLYYSGYHGSGELLIRAFELTDAPSSGSYSNWIKNFTWNNHSARSSTMLDAVDMTTKNVYDYVNWDITEAVLRWYQSSSNNKGITLEANNATNLTAYASFGGYTHGTSRPALYIVYRNAIGVEPYYTYQTQSAGQAGTAYVSDNNLQLTLSHTDLAIDSTVNPFTLSHVYNSAYGTNQFGDGKGDIQSLDYTKMVLGAGWKLNVQETVRKCNVADLVTTSYVYNDSDGTEHYFYYDSQKGCYQDEDGLNLSLTVSGTTYTITDEKNNKKIFYNGYLSEIRSAIGNSIYIAYNETASGTIDPNKTNWRPAASGNRITGIYRRNKNASLEWLVSFTWDSTNRLASVMDKIKDKTINYYYESIGGVIYLTGISSMGNSAAQAKYVYDTSRSQRMQEAYDVEAKRGIEYTYRGNASKWDVSRMSEYYAASYNSAKSYGAKIRAYQFNPYSTSYRYYGDDRITSDDPANSGSAAAADDLVSVFYFDAFGRTVNTVGYNTDKAYVLGGSVTSFTQNNGTSAKNNRVVAQANAGMYYANMLDDSSFEGCGVAAPDSVSAAWKLMNSGGRVEFYGAETHSGGVSAGLRILNETTDKTKYQAGLYQNVLLQAGKSYCFSAYLRITQEKENWAYGNTYLYFADSNGDNVFKGDEISFDTGKIANGWMRVYVAYTPSASGEYRVGACLYNVKGTAEYDDLQLELGTAPNSYNLLRDSGAEFYGSTNYKGWKCSSGAKIIKASETAEGAKNKIDGEKTIQLTGHTGQDRYTYQDVVVSEEYSTTYLLSGWAKAPSLPFDVKETYESTDRFFGLKARVYYADGSSEATFIPFNCYCEDWQYVCGTIVPKQKKQVKKISLYADYSHNVGTAYFDDIALTKEPVQTYSYDENGKVKAANDAGEEQNYTFSGADLTKCINSNGTFTFTYDAYHNLTTATNDNVTMRLTYDDAGNMTYSKLTNSKDSWYMQSSAAYTSNKNVVQASRDVNGNRTEYTYTNGTLPQTVKDPQGHITAYSYDSNLRMSTAKYYENDSAAAALAALYYSYSSGILTQIRRKTDTNTWHHLITQTDKWGNPTAIRINGSTNGTASGTGITLASYDYEPNNGKRIRQKYGNGSAMEYSYDFLDRLTETVYYENYGTASKKVTQKVYNVYNGLGFLTETGTKNKDDNVTEKCVFEYDSLGRLIRSAEYAYTYSGSNVTCTLVQRTEHDYDKDNRLTAQNWTIGNTDFSESYTYNENDGSLQKLKTSAGSIDYTYDNLKRLQKATATDASGNVLYNTAYAYRTVSGNQTSAQVEYRNVRTGKETSGTPIEGKKYNYDTLGNIIKISELGEDNKYYTVAAYEYDAQNQLTKETYYDTEGAAAHTYKYTYDAAGNILSEDKDGTVKTYTYGDSVWHDKLTAVNGQNITYDACGNPVSYNNGKQWSFTWENGRNLASSQNETQNHTGKQAQWTDKQTESSYTYDADGIRTEKITVEKVYKYRSRAKIRTVSGRAATETYQQYLSATTTTQHSYVTQNGKVVRETIGSGSTAKVLDFTYDESGRPFALTYTDGTATPETYYYILNQQGDVVKLVEILSSGKNVQSYSVVASYTYDAWGNVTATGSIAAINPLRYRGYYYDAETGFYYLQSRYYDPMNHRFISADAYATTNVGNSLSYNMFAYCLNNPVMRADPTGHSSYADVNENGIADYLEVRWIRMTISASKQLGSNRYICSDDGKYINNQENCGCSNWALGVSTIAESGCGIVAAYNILLSRGIVQTFAEVYLAAIYCNALVDNGKHGTRDDRIILTLMLFDPTMINAGNEQSAQSIFILYGYYENGKRIGGHFACAISDGAGSFKMYNAIGSISTTFYDYECWFNTVSPNCQIDYVIYIG